MNTRPLNPRNVSDFLAQCKSAEEYEVRILARLAELEKQGIVKHGIQDSWIVLDSKRYFDEMGIWVAEGTPT